MSESREQTEQVAGIATIRRINRELSEIQTNPSSHWAIQTVGDNLLEYHFTIRGPPGTDFEGGLYHGRLLLPFNYPFAAPSIMLLNPSGRFEVGKKVCLSMTSFHSELWQPAWGIRTMIEALRSFFPTPGDGAIGALDWPSDTRKKIAIDSVEWTCDICLRRNAEILPFADESAVIEKRTVEVPDEHRGDTALPVDKDSSSDPSDGSVPSPIPTPSLEERGPARPPTTRPVHQGESAQLVVINFAIYSLAFIIIALIIDIIRNPYS